MFLQLQHNTMENRHATISVGTSVSDTKLAKVSNTNRLFYSILYASVK